MGAGASKQAGKAAASAGRRQYPSSSSILNSSASSSGTPSQARPNPTKSPPSDSKDSHIDLDGRDPQFGASLRRLGPAVPVERADPEKSAFPTSSQPPLGQQGLNIFPPANRPGGPARNAGMMIVDARKKIQDKWEQENESLGRKGFEGRTLVNAKDLKEALKMIEAGVSPAEVEGQMRMQSGILQKLNKPGLYKNV